MHTLYTTRNRVWWWRPRAQFREYLTGQLQRNSALPMRAACIVRGDAMELQPTGRHVADAQVIDSASPSDVDVVCQHIVSIYGACGMCSVVVVVCTRVVERWWFTTYYLLHTNILVRVLHAMYVHYVHFVCIRHCLCVLCRIRFRFRKILYMGVVFKFQ